MADKLRTTYPVEVVFTPGEQPSAEKLTAISTQAKTGMRIIENAIGDLWGTGGDAVFKGLQMPSLGRVLGENNYLNPALFSLQDANGSGIPFYYIEKLDEVFDKKTTGYLTFKPYNNTNYTGQSGDDGFGFLVSDGSAQITFSTTLTQGGIALKEEEIGISNPNKFFVDTDTGRFRFPTPFESGTHIYIGYWVNPDDWAFGKILGDDGNILPGVIPDPREVGSSTLSATPVSTSVYDIKIPQRKPLNIDVHDMEQKIPQPCLFGSKDFNDESDTSTGGYGSSELPRIWSISESHTSHNPSFHRYTIPVFDALANDALFPEGTIKLVESVNNKTIHGLIFKKKNDSTIEVADPHGFLESSVINSEQFYLVSSGPSASKSVSILRQIVLNHSHDGKHQENKLTHSFFDGNAPAENRDGMVWTHSNLDQDDHIQYLHRENSSSTAERDPNHNAMLDDLIISQKTLDTATGLYIGDLTTQDSNKIYFGIDVDTSPHIYGYVWGGGDDKYRIQAPSQSSGLSLGDETFSKGLSLKAGNGSLINLGPVSTEMILPSNYDVNIVNSSADIDGDLIVDPGIREDRNLMFGNYVITREFGPTYVRLEANPTYQDLLADAATTYGNAVLELADKGQDISHNRGRLWWDGQNEKLKLQWSSFDPSIGSVGLSHINYSFDGIAPTVEGADPTNGDASTLQPTALEIWKENTGLKNLIVSSNPNNSQLYEDLETTQFLGLTDLKRTIGRFEGPVQAEELFQEYPDLTAEGGYSSSVQLGSESGIASVGSYSYHLSFRIPKEDTIGWCWSEPISLGTIVTTGTETIEVTFQVPANIYEYILIRTHTVLALPNIYTRHAFLGQTHLSKEDMAEYLAQTNAHKTFAFVDHRNFQSPFNDGLHLSGFIEGINPQGLIYKEILTTQSGTVTIPEWSSDWIVHEDEIFGLGSPPVIDTWPTELIDQTNESGHLGNPSFTEAGKNFHVTKQGNIFSSGGVQVLGGLQNLIPSGDIAVKELQLKDQTFEGFGKTGQLGGDPLVSSKWTKHKAAIKRVAQHEGIVGMISHATGSGEEKFRLYDDSGNVVDPTTHFIGPDGFERSAQDFHLVNSFAEHSRQTVLLADAQAGLDFPVTLNGNTNGSGSTWKPRTVEFGRVYVAYATILTNETDYDSNCGLRGSSSSLSDKIILSVNPPATFYTGPFSDFGYSDSQQWHYSSQNLAIGRHFDFIGWDYSPVRYYETGMVTINGVDVPNTFAGHESQGAGEFDESAYNAEHKMSVPHQWKHSSNKFLKLFFRAVNKDGINLVNFGSPGNLDEPSSGTPWVTADDPPPNTTVIPNYILDQLRFKITYMEAGEHKETIQDSNLTWFLGDGTDF